MADITVRQGDSTDTYKFTVTNNGAAVTDLTGYSCRYSVSPYLGGASTLTGTVSAVTEDSSDLFPFKLTPTETELLDVGDYAVTIEIINASIEFNRESILELRVNTQGYA